MATRVYSYGVHYRWAQNLPESVLDQLWLGHQLREHLVDVEHEFEAAKKTIWSRVPEVAELEQQLDTIEEQVAARLDAVAEQRKLQRRRDPEGFDAAQLGSELARLRKQAKKLRAQRREAIASTYRQQTTVADELQRAQDARHAAYKATYAKFVQEQGLYHGTHHEILDAHKTAVKLLDQKRKQGQPAQLRHHRFDGTGVLRVDLKHRPGKTTRDRAEVGDPTSPHRNVFQLPQPSHPDTYDPITDTQWDQLPTGARKRAGRVTARFRVRAGLIHRDPEAVTEIPVQLHRLLPENGIIKSAVLVVTRVGAQRRVKLNVSVTVPDPTPVPADATVAVHFGWRRDRTGTGAPAVRAMTWLADTPMTVWRDVIAANPDYPALNECVTLSDDLMSGTVLLPDSWCTGITLAEQYRSQADTEFNEIRDAFANWLDELAAAGHRVFHPTFRDRATGDPEPLTGAMVRRWRAHRRLVTIAHRWAADAPNLPGADQWVSDLQQWQRRNRHLTDLAAFTLRKATLRRDDLYRQVANLIVESYDRVVMDEVDHAELAQLPATDTALPNKAVTNLGWQRKNTAAATLRMFIEQAAARDGVTTERLKVEAVSRDCATCGTRNLRIRGAMTITCKHCGTKYDVDTNAVHRITNHAA